MGVGNFNNTQYEIDVDAAVQSQNQAGNYSVIYWRVIIRKKSGTGFAGSNGWRVIADSNLGANPDLWDQSGSSWSFQNGSNSGEWTYAQGTFNLPHDANGYAQFFVNGSATFGAGTAIGSASAGSGTKDAPRIPKTPGAPNPIGIDQITHESMRYQFSGTTDGGSAITGWQVGYGTDPNTPESIISSNGNSTITGLKPYTDYYVWSRGLNAVGAGPWSARSSAKTLAGGRVKVGGVWVTAVPYVKVNGAWVVGVPYVKVAGAWVVGN